MQFTIPELRANRYVQKEARIEPAFLGAPPDMVEFTTPVDAKVKAEIIGPDVLVSGEVSTVIKCSCALCLTNFDKKIEGRFKQSFDEKENPIDVDYYIKEAVILDLPLKAVCKEKCLGLCPTCGQNRNEKKCSCPVEETHRTWDALKEFRFPK